MRNGGHQLVSCGPSTSDAPHVFDSGGNSGGQQAHGVGIVEVFIGGLGPLTQEASVRKALGPMGLPEVLIWVRLIKSEEASMCGGATSHHSECTGVGYLGFASRPAAERAICLTPLHVSMCVCCFDI